MNSLHIGGRDFLSSEGTVQLASKFTARIGENAYLARIFARHVRLLAFDARVSKSLAQETMLASYAARDYKCGDQLWRLPWTKNVPLKVTANVN